VKEDNFGDHKLTQTGRVDATTRAPLEMGIGGKKKVYYKCPKCNKVIECKKTTISFICGNCRSYFTIDKAIKADVNEVWNTQQVHLESDYLKFRKLSEDRAEKYRLGKR
jgi:hypothetical protein